MGNHFRAPDTFVQFTPETRSQIERAIESLIALLDQCDGDADIEDDGLFEETGDDEPWMAAGAAHWQSHDQTVIIDLEQDCEGATL